MTNAIRPKRNIAQTVVIDRVGVSRTTLYEMIKAGEFPQPIRVRGRVLWPEQAVEDWIEALFAEVNTPPA